MWPCYGCVTKEDGKQKANVNVFSLLSAGQKAVSRLIQQSRRIRTLYQTKTESVKRKT